MQTANCIVSEKSVVFSSDMLAAVLLLGAVSACAWCLWQHSRRRLVALAERLPGPPGWPVLGNALTFMSHPEEILTTLTGYLKDYGDYVKFWLGPDLLVCVNNPADIRLLLMSNKINLKGPLYEFMKTFVGPGVLSEGGPKWHSHRKIAKPSYSKKTVQRYTAVFNDTAEDLANRLCRKDPTVTFNVYDDVVDCTTMSVCQTIIGLSKEESRNVKSMDTFVRESHRIYDFIFANMTRWWLHIPVVYWLSGRKTRERYYVKVIEEMTADMLGKRRRVLKERIPEEEKLGVVDRFILSGELTDQEIKWEIVTFFTASQEATAKIASTVLVILAHLPEWQEKVYNEILQVLGPEDNYVSDDQVKKLVNLNLVYKEAIRYMPIGAFIQRTVEEEVSVNNGNIVLPKGAAVVFPIHSLHRDPRFWDEPDQVDPGRFSPGTPKWRDPDAYLPFSLGAMDCMGRVFAESLIKILAVRLLRRLELRADGRIEGLPLHVAISVKFARGYNLRVRPRS